MYTNITFDKSTGLDPAAFPPQAGRDNRATLHPENTFGVIQSSKFKISIFES